MPAEFHCRRVLYSVGLCLMLGACDQADRPHQHSTSENVQSTNTLSADEAWHELTSSGERPNRHSGESSLAYFMRSVELSDIRRRELGLKFWNQYPQDPRRYKWLQLTVHMPPHYAVDIDEWAENETRLKPNAAVLDHRARAKWEDLYPRLRQTFWNAPEVTDQERRFLWMGELEQKLLRTKEAHARGETVDAEPILTNILSFAEAYTKPFSENDKSTFRWSVGGVIRLATRDCREILGLNNESLFAYARALVETGNTVAVDIGHSIQIAMINSDGEMPSLYPAEWSEVERAWHSLPTYPSDQPSSLEESIAFYHEQFVNTRKYRDIGARRLWNEYPDRELRLQWIGSTHWSAPTYAKHFVDAIRQKSADGLAPVEVDEIALGEWEQLYAELRREVWDHPETTDQERGQMRGKEVWRELWDIQTYGKVRQDTIAVPTLLDEIHTLYTEYENVKDTSLLSSIILRLYRNFGLNDDELLAFFEPMQKYVNQELRDLAKAAQNQIELRTRYFRFSAFTMQGEPFDIVNMRGEIILVDHWATTCSSCIAAMPRIHDIYERYKDRGFEVVSIAYDGTSQRKRIERIEKELGLTWTTLDGEGQWGEISEKYGYQGFPQYMLLNRDGMLHAGTGEVDMGRNLEALLKEMLADEAVEKEAVTVH